MSPYYGLSERARYRRRAFEIHRSLPKGMTQVRWYRGRFMTFQFPAPQGHGVRGQMVAIYNTDAKLEWIENDLLEFVESLGLHTGDTSPAELA